MNIRSSNSSSMTVPVSSPTEIQPLLSPVGMLTFCECLYQACAPPMHLCLQSKAAVLILLWLAMAGTSYTLAMDAMVAIGIILGNDKDKFHNVLVNILIPYVCLALVMLLYPLSGFVADIWCGQFRLVIISMCILIICSRSLVLLLAVH